MFDLVDKMIIRNLRIIYKDKELFFKIEDDIYQIVFSKDLINYSFCVFQSLEPSVNPNEYLIKLFGPVFSSSLLTKYAIAFVNCSFEAVGAYKITDF